MLTLNQGRRAQLVVGKPTTETKKKEYKKFRASGRFPFGNGREPVGRGVNAVGK